MQLHMHTITLISNPYLNNALSRHLFEPIGSYIKIIKLIKLKLFTHFGIFAYRVSIDGLEFIIECLIFNI